MGKIVGWGASVVEPGLKSVETNEEVEVVSNEECDSYYEVPLTETVEMSGLEDRKPRGLVGPEDLSAQPYSDPVSSLRETSFFEAEETPVSSCMLELRCRPCEDMASVSSNLSSESAIEKPYEAKIIQALEKLRFAWIKERFGEICYDISHAEMHGAKSLINQAAKVEDLDYFQISLALLEISERRFRSCDDEYPHAKRGDAPHLQELITFIDKKSQGLA